VKLMYSLYMILHPNVRTQGENPIDFLGPNESQVMSHLLQASHVTEAHLLRTSAGWLGLALAGAIAAAGVIAAGTPVAQRCGLSALTLAIVFGMVAGNTFFPRIAAQTSGGVDFSKSTVLRAGIILFGLRITFQEITAVGWAGILIDVLIVVLTFVIAVQLGTRLFGLDRQTSMLIGAGSALCGAAAVMATEPVVRGQAHKVSVAVATVVVFGTIAMFAYPLLYGFLGLSEHTYGVFTGSTVHEVAQVVAAGRSVSEAAADTAVIEKMLRIMMLAPFLLVLSGFQRKSSPNAAAGGGAVHAPIIIPWFAVLFVGASAINSLHVLPQHVVSNLTEIDTLLLATAMAALGLRTHIGAIRQAGLRPLLLAAMLFVFLVLGGYAINRSVIGLLT
jgi:uncharacterized integral membrane protein (TIGR00698 family)